MGPRTPKESQRALQGRIALTNTNYRSIFIDCQRVGENFSRNSITSLIINDLPEHLLVRRLVKPHDQGPALPEGGGAEVAAGPEEEGEEVGLGGLVLLEVEADGLLAFGGVERVHAIEEGEGILLPEAPLPGVGLGGWLDPLLRKEPLRLSAGGSARAVVVPVGLGGHGAFPPGVVPGKFAGKLDGLWLSC